MPPRNKKHSGSSHDKRKHENGSLATPAKRLGKQKSSEHLNGNISPPHHLVSTHSQPDPTAAAQSSSLLAAPGDLRERHAPPEASNSLGSHLSEEPDDTAVPATANGHTKVVQDSDSYLPRSAMAELEGFSRGQRANDLQPVTGAVPTVVEQRSILDVIAILLLLLQLPSHALTFVQLAYTVMTFGNNSSHWTIPSFSSMPDLISSHLPSLLSTFFIDLLVMGCFLAFTTFTEDFSVVLDSAQAVIAVSFGGGSVAKEGWTVFILCGLIIGLPHLLQSRLWQTYGMPIMWTILSKASAGYIKPAEPPFTYFPRRVYSRNIARYLLEVHIITQGLVRSIRRWHERSSEYSSSVVTRRNESEAMGPSTNAFVAGGIDANAEAVRSANVEVRPPGPLPTGRESRQSSFGTPRRRRRPKDRAKSEQPLWAAIADVKVLYTKEVEQEHASRDSFEAKSDNPERLGDARLNRSEDRVWISSIGDTEVTFNAAFDPKHKAPDGDESTEEMSLSESIQVRINCTPWHSVEIHKVEAISDDASEVFVEGTITGLSPSANYSIEFFHDKRELLYFTKIRTRPPASLSLATTSLVQPSPDTMSPSSPTSTLKTSIAVVETKLAEHRNRLRKNKKDHKNNSTALRREVENLESRLASSAGNEDRQRQRLAQLRASITQAEASSATIASEIEDLAAIPEAELETSVASKQKWQEQKDRRAAIEKELAEIKAESNRQIVAQQSENASIHQKRERLETRLSRLDTQREKLMASNTQTRDRKANMEAQRLNTISQWQQRERQIQEAIANFNAQRREIENRLMNAEPSRLSGVFNTLPTVPQTPEGSVSGFNPTLPSSFSMLHTQQPPGTSPIHSRQNSVRKTRGRSSSMLSDMSGFTEEEIAPSQFQQSALAGTKIPRNKSAGSHASSGQDPTSPPSQKLSPIGSEIGRGSPRHGRN